MKEKYSLEGEPEEKANAGMVKSGFVWLLSKMRKHIRKRGMVYICIIDRNMREHLYIKKPSSNSVEIKGKTFILDDEHATETSDKIKKYYFWEEQYERIPMGRISKEHNPKKSSEYVNLLLHHARLVGRVKPRGIFGMDAQSLLVLVIGMVLAVALLKGGI